MSKYQNSIIYKIYDNTNGNVYYGSTYNLLRVRMQGHIKDYKCRRKCASKQIILNGNYSYSMVEPYPCNSKQELHARERYWIENFDCINKVVPGRTNKEYYQDTRAQRKEYEVDYYVKNKEKIKEQKAEHYIKNKEELNKKSREYHAINKEELNNKKAEYYTKNKEKISKENATKIVCECGSEINKSSISTHRKSAKHAKLMTLICPPCPP